MKQKALHQKSWDSLTPKQKHLREQSLDVLSKSRKSNKSISKLSKEKNIPLKTVLKHTNAYKKINNRWTPKKFDRISRVMLFNESGKEISIETRDSRIASKIGKYHSAVGEYLNTGNAKKLNKFKNKSIKDTQGNIHIFETDLEKIVEIKQRKEEPEFAEVYGG
jgi:hypothetical protein